MWTFNSCADGSQLEVESYDKAIEILEFIFLNTYTLNRIENLGNDLAYIIKVDNEPLFMLTNLRKATDIIIGDK